MINIPGYTIKEILHENTTKITYRAYAEDNTPVIVKSLKKEYPTEEETTAFTHEYEITKSLNIDGIIKILRFIKVDHVLVLLSEDISGTSLKKHLTTKRVTLQDFLNIAIQLSGTLRELHVSNVIHRDIKPDNIIIQPESGQVKIADFSISTMQSIDDNVNFSLNFLTGSLEYMSPEQTGRMNRVIDYRTDFYSLGVTFYELVTGQLPFQCEDANEWIHAHIAKTPIPPHKIDGEIPLVVSDLIMKLLEKNVDDRYKSAYGLKSDLEECLSQWEQARVIAPFALGKNDVASSLQVSQKIYGRQDEMKKIKNIFEQVCIGSAEMVLLSGNAGIGKTTFINQSLKPQATNKGYFISGKFDQVKRDIPYVPLIQAFQELIQQIAAENKETYYDVRKRLLSALNTNASVITDLIPEVSLLIGDYPPAKNLPSAESKHRFMKVFHDFVSVFTTKEHSLVIFLDNLQWADTASLQLIQHLYTHLDSRYLLIVGAYRTSDVSETHPVMLMANEINKIGGNIHFLSLDHLELTHTHQFVIDSFSCNEANALDLAEILHEKTAGNPFFMEQLLQTAYKEKLLTFNPSKNSWNWDLDSIKDLHKTENVVDLIINKLKLLPSETQNVLVLGACIGNRFDLKTLAAVTGVSSTQTAKAIWTAVIDGIVVPVSNNASIHQLDSHHSSHHTSQHDLQTNRIVSHYEFLHDRVQQAAYLLITEDKKKQYHLQIGRILDQETDPSKLEDSIFTIVDHLNLAISLIESHHTSEKEKLCNYNVIAGLKAKKSNAYLSALSYFKTGKRLLSTDAWSTSYNQTFTLYAEYCHCQYLCANFDMAEQLADYILEHAQSHLDKAKIYSLKMIFNANLGNHPETIRLGLAGLDELGISLSDSPNKLFVLKELLFTRHRLKLKKSQALVNLPEMKLPVQLTAMELLLHMIPSTNAINPELFAMVTMKMVNLSLKHGNSDASAFAYTSFSLLSFTILKDFGLSNDLEKLSFALCEKFENISIKSKINFGVGGYLKHWTEHVNVGIEYLQDAFACGSESGNLLYAGYSLSFMITSMHIAGHTLGNVNEKIDQYLAYSNRMQMEDVTRYLLTAKQVSMLLKGLTEHPGTFSSETYDEPQFAEQILNSNVSPTIMAYYLYKMQCYYLLGNYDAAFDIANDSRKYLDSILGNILCAEHNYYYSLILTARFHQGSEHHKRQNWAQLKKNQQQMKKWSALCPSNYLHKYLVIDAEMAKLKNKDLKAIHLYAKAVLSAREHGYIQNEAIANELAAAFYLEKGLTKNAKAYIGDAIYGYSKWGASAKITQLQKKFPTLLSFLTSSTNEVAAGSTTQFSSFTTSVGTTTSGSNALDLATIMKTAQTISSEIKLEPLLGKLMMIVMENAGAQKGLLILKKDDALYVEAECSIDSEEMNVMQSIPLEDSLQLSKAIIWYVVRSQEHVVLHHATKEGLFINDEYILTHQPKSILCIPILDQGQLFGILYLENNLSTEVFSQQRVDFLQMLLSQIAVSIKNARLYASVEESKDQIYQWNVDLEQNIQQRTTAINNLLNNANQGFLYFGDDLLVKREYSAECLRIFNARIENKSFAELLYHGNNEEKTFLKTIFKDIFEEKDTGKQSLYLSLLPEDATINERFIHIEYKFLPDIQKANAQVVMAILTDMTDKRLLEKQMEEEKNVLKMVVRVVTNINDFKNCVNDYTNFCAFQIQDILKSKNSFQDILYDLYKEIHTLKGNFHQLGLFMVSAKLHQLETELEYFKNDTQDCSMEELVTFLASCNLDTWIDDDLAILKDTLGETFLDQEDTLTINPTSVIELENKIIALLSSAEVALLLPQVRKLRSKPFKVLLKEYQDYVIKLASQTEKIVYPLAITGGDVLVDTRMYESFAKSLGHVFRNMIDHGIETAEARVQADKDMSGTISCQIDVIENHILVKIADNGRGIDIHSLREKSISKEIFTRELAYKVSEHAIIELIFRNDFSTRNDTTDLSGRGFGLAAVKQEVDALDGQIEVITEEGIGTAFHFLLPYDNILETTNACPNDLMRTLQDATIEFLQEQTKLTIDHNLLSEIVGSEEIPFLEITAFVSINGLMKGTFILTVDRSVAEEMVKQFAIGDIIEQREEAIEDIVGEALNIIIRNGIKELPSLDNTVIIDFPITFRSQASSIRHPALKGWSLLLETAPGNIIISFITKETG